MAVHLPSDLIADVMRNAEPARRKAAIAKLDAMGPASEPAFASVVESKGVKVGGATNGGLAAAIPADIWEQGRVSVSAYQGFEQMVLRNLFETLLPDEESGAFGGGPSAGVWRSLAADQLAGVYTESGGIGIQAMLDPGARPEGPRREAGWPYFSMHGIGLLRG